MIPFLDVRHENTLPDAEFCTQQPSKDTQRSLSIHLDVDRLLDYNTIVSYNEEQTVSALNALYETYVPEGMDRSKLRAMAYDMMALDSHESIDLERVDSQYRRLMYQAYQLYAQLLKHNLVGNANNDTQDKQRKMSTIFEVITYMRDIIQSEQMWSKYFDMRTNLHIPAEVQIFKFSPFDYSLTTPYQNLIIYVLRKLYVAQYKKMTDMCYEQVFTKGHIAYPTHAWKPVCTIKEFVNKVIHKEENFTMWQALTHSDTVDKKISNYLECHDDPEFPRLNMDRNLFAFNNGLLRLGRFERDSKKMLAAPVLPEFFPYDTMPVSDNYVACRFFDVEFPYESVMDCADWYDIPTPAIQSILDFQQLPADVCRHAYVMLGRLFYPVNEYDNWQIMPFFRGVANSGKSMILRMIHSCFAPENVGIMSSNMEHKFWASALYDKMVFLCFEARAEMSINQGDFQSAISGEEMLVPIKNKVAKSVTWSVPGAMAGNDIPGWLDAAGSISRRLVVFEFTKTVRNSDQTLIIKLKNEIAPFIFKCNCAYIEAVHKSGKYPIWNWQPPYFAKTQEKLAAAISPLRAFILESDKIKRNEKWFIPSDDFRALFKQFCESRQFRTPKWAATMYEPIFEFFGIVEVKDELEYDGKPATQGTWYRGVGSIEVWGQ